MTPELMRVIRQRNSASSTYDFKRFFRMDAVSLGIRSIGLLCAFALFIYILHGRGISSEVNSYRLRHPLSIYTERVLPCTEDNPCSIKIIADLDKQSRIVNTPNSSEELLFQSYLLSGKLHGDSSNAFHVKWDNEPLRIRGKLNEAGRGLELSELILYNNALLSFDDRTGVIYEMLQDDRPVPRHVINEGNGETSKGMKIEWATVKDDLLYVGSFGKEFTSSNGSVILNENNFWVATVTKDGNIQYIDWKPVYNLVRKVVDADFPGYMIHEAVNWSPVLKKWIFLPRRVSSERYDEVLDESRGSNRMILVTEDFSSAEVKTVGKIMPTRGFSSFKFIPGTQNEQIVALKSEEKCENDLCSQKSYITVFTQSGEVLMEEQEIPSLFKYEGIEFVA